MNYNNELVSLQILLMLICKCDKSGTATLLNIDLRHIN